MQEPPDFQNAAFVSSCELDITADGWFACFRLILKLKESSIELNSKLIEFYSQKAKNLQAANELIGCEHASQDRTIVVSIYTQNISLKEEHEQVGKFHLPVPGCLEKILTEWFGKPFFLTSIKEPLNFLAKNNPDFKSIPVKINDELLFQIHGDSALSRNQPKPGRDNPEPIGLLLRTGVFTYESRSHGGNPALRIRSSGMDGSSFLSFYIYPDYCCEKPNNQASSGPESKKTRLPLFQHIATPPSPNYFQPQGPTWDKLCFVICYDQQTERKPQQTPIEITERGNLLQSPEPVLVAATNYPNSANIEVVREDQHLNNPPIAWLDLVQKELRTLLLANLSQLKIFSPPSNKPEQEKSAASKQSGYEFNIINTISAGYQLRDRFIACSELSEPKVIENIDKYFEHFRNVKGNSKYAIVFEKILKQLHELDFKTQRDSSSSRSVAGSKSVLSGLWTHKHNCELGRGLWAEGFDKLTRRFMYNLNIGSLFYAMKQRVPEIHSESQSPP